MRTIVDLPPDLLDALDAWRRARGLSRAEAVRRGVMLLCEPGRWNEALEASRGLLAGSGATDGLARQEELRAEWDDR